MQKKSKKLVHCHVPLKMVIPFLEFYELPAPLSPPHQVRLLTIL